MAEQRKYTKNFRGLSYWWRLYGSIAWGILKPFWGKRQVAIYCSPLTKEQLSVLWASEFWGSMYGTWELCHESCSRWLRGLPVLSGSHTKEELCARFRHSESRLELWPVVSTAACRGIHGGCVYGVKCLLSSTRKVTDQTPRIVEQGHACFSRELSPCCSKIAPGVLLYSSRYWVSGLGTPVTIIQRKAGWNSGCGTIPWDTRQLSDERSITSNPLHPGGLIMMRTDQDWRLRWIWICLSYLQCLCQHKNLRNNRMPIHCYGMPITVTQIKVSGCDKRHVAPDYKFYCSEAAELRHQQGGLS